MGSEDIKHSSESFRNGEQFKDLSDRPHTSLERPKHKSHEITTEILENIKAQVETQAVSGKEYSRGEDSETKQHPVLVSKELKQMTFTRALTRTRKQLSAPERGFSKFIHASAVDKTSEVISKSIARPSAMLGGSLVGMLGSFIFLMLVRNNGYEYNFFVLFILFAIGYAVGLFVEVVFRIIAKKRSA